MRCADLCFETATIRVSGKRDVERSGCRYRRTSELAGFCREHLDAADRRELAGLIDDYRRGVVPLPVPQTLLRHHVERHRIADVQGQASLRPHPQELMLRTHV